MAELGTEFFLLDLMIDSGASGISRILCAWKGKTTSRDAQPSWKGQFPLPRGFAALPAIPSSYPQFLFELVCRCADEGSCLG